LKLTNWLFTFRYFFTININLSSVFEFQPVVKDIGSNWMHFDEKDMHTLESGQRNFVILHIEPSMLSLELKENVCLSFQFLNHFQDSDEIQYRTLN
jgi:hypothetical protein